MKSKLISSVFSAVDSVNAKTFAAHLKTLIQLKKEDRATLLRILPSYRLARTPEERRLILNKCVGSARLDRNIVINSIGVLNFLLNQILDSKIGEQDAPLWPADLKSLNILTDPESDSFASLISDIIQVGDSTVKPEIQRRRAASGYMPNLTGLFMTTELRGVSDDEFDGTMPVADYKPSVRAVVPVISVTITLSRSDPEKNVHFQIEEAELDLIIDQCLAAKKDLAALKSFLGI